MNRESQSSNRLRFAAVEPFGPTTPRNLRLAHALAALLLAICFAGKASAQSASPQGTDREIVRSVGVTLSRQGFSPSEMTLTPGKTVFFFLNKSGREEPTMQIDREAGSGQPSAEKLYDKKSPPGRRKSATLIDLTPGRYIISEPGRVGAVCRITVSPR